MAAQTASATVATSSRKEDAENKDQDQGSTAATASKEDDQEGSTAATSSKEDARTEDQLRSNTSAVSRAGNATMVSKEGPTAGARTAAEADARFTPLGGDAAPHGEVQRGPGDRQTQEKDESRDMGKHLRRETKERKGDE